MPAFDAVLIGREHSGSGTSKLGKESITYLCQMLLLYHNTVAYIYIPYYQRKEANNCTWQWTTTIDATVYLLSINNVVTHINQ